MSRGCRKIDMASSSNTVYKQGSVVSIRCPMTVITNKEVYLTIGFSMAATNFRQELMRKSRN